MTNDFPPELLEDSLAVQQGELSDEDFHQRYRRQRAILTLGMTGFTSTALKIGELGNLLRILDAQKVCIPVLKDFGANLIRCFADNMAAIFDNPNETLLTERTFVALKERTDILLNRQNSDDQLFPFYPAVLVT